MLVGIPGCGGLLTSNTGQFSSPQHPETYANNLDCEWLIRVPLGDRIELDFLSFDVEGHRTCLWVEKYLERDSLIRKKIVHFFNIADIRDSHIFLKFSKLFSSHRRKIIHRSVLFF